MKKVLLASTALLLTAGFASAQSIELSGSAAAGIKYNSEADPSDGQVNPHSEVNFVITGSGSTDLGLEFGAFIDIDKGGVDDAEVFISGTFGTITMGGVSPATDGFGIADVGFDGVGIDNIAEYLKNATAGADVHYAYSLSGLTFSAATEFGDTQSYSVAVEYDTGMFSAGIGYADSPNGGVVEDSLVGDTAVAVGNSTITVVGGLEQGAVSANAMYSNWSVDGGGGADSYGLDVSFDTGAATVTGVYSNLSVDGFGRVATGYGLGASVPLGGGLSVAGGVGIVDLEGADNITVADLGLTMSF